MRHLAGDGGSLRYSRPNLKVELVRAAVLAPTPGLPSLSKTRAACARPARTSCLLSVRGSVTPRWHSALAEQWDGSTWSVMPIPAGPSDDVSLASVSCSSPTACLAVGGYQDGGNWQNLAESWDGSTWSVLSSSTVQPPGARFTPCLAPPLRPAPSSGRLFGAGRRNLGDRGPSSQPTGVDALLNALSCPTTTTCVLVGATTPNSSCNPQHCTLPHFRSLAEVWNGAVWSIEQVPGGKCSTVECRVDILRAVSCAGAMTCIGVGRGVTASWNGTAWANEPPLPDPISQRRPGTPGAGTSCVRTRLCLGRFRGLCRDRRQ